MKFTLTQLETRNEYHTLIQSQKIFCTMIFISKINCMDFGEATKIFQQKYR